MTDFGIQSGDTVRVTKDVPYLDVSLHEEGVVSSGPVGTVVPGPDGQLVGHAAVQVVFAGGVVETVPVGALVRAPRIEPHPAWWVRAIDGGPRIMRAWLPGCGRYVAVLDAAAHVRRRVLVGLCAVACVVGLLDASSVLMRVFVLLVTVAMVVVTVVNMEAVGSPWLVWPDDTPISYLTEDEARALAVDAVSAMWGEGYGHGGVVVRRRDAAVRVARRRAGW